MGLSIVYHKNVIEFVTVAKEYVVFFEELDVASSKVDFLNKIQKILSLLYLKASLLPEVESEIEEPVEKFCTEEYYLQIQEAIRSILRTNDEEMLVNASSQTIDQQEWVAISEILSDIFQSLYDFISAYRIGSEDLMEAALAECTMDSKTYWGVRLLIALEGIHDLLYGERLVEDDEDRYNNKITGEHDTSDWIINKIRDENDDE